MNSISSLYKYLKIIKELKPQYLYFITLFLIFLVQLGCSDSPEKTKNANSKNLKTAYTESFLIGAAINENIINEQDTLALELIDKEFNTITPENTMKWMFIHPHPDTFYFNTADKYVALGKKNNMALVGHTLVWHSQIAEWMNTIKDSAEMSRHLEKHIHTIVTRYKGKIDEWDVVNEALNEDGTLRESLFFNIMGDAFIEQSFINASKADPGAKLLYNDYNLWKPEKREGVVRLVKRLQSKGIKIDGVGMQAHWSLDGPSLEDIEKSIIAYSELGLEVQFTELDITVLPNPWDLNGAAVNQNYDELADDPKMNPYPLGLPDSVQTKLAQRYENIFKLFLKHSDKISRITFWGVNDGGSWLNGWPIKGRTNYPLLFDRNYQPKQAYHRLINLTKE